MKCNQLINDMMASHVEAAAWLDSVAFSMSDVIHSDKTWYCLASVVQIVAFLSVAKRLCRLAKTTRTVEQELEFGDYNEKFLVEDKNQRVCTVNSFALYERQKKLTRTVAKHSVKFALVSSAILGFQLVQKLARYFHQGEGDVEKMLSLFYDIYILSLYHLMLGSTSFLIPSVSANKRHGKKLGFALVLYTLFIFLAGSANLKFSPFSLAKLCIGYFSQFFSSFKFGKLALGPEAKERTEIPVDSIADHPLQQLCEDSDGKLKLKSFCESPNYVVFLYSQKKKALFWHVDVPVLLVQVEKNQNSNKINSTVYFTTKSQDVSINELFKLSSSQKEAVSVENEKLLPDTETQTLDNLVSAVGRFSLQGQFTA